MRIYDFGDLLRSGELSNRRTVISIGVFDGVHKGHQRVFSLLKQKAEEAGAVSLVISFSTNPKARAKGNLDTLRLRAEYVGSFGIDFFAVIDFSGNFSKTTAGEFAKILTELCTPCAAVVGADFRFGNPREAGDARDLALLLAANGVSCDVTIVDSVLDEDGMRISSTHLRQLISSGDLGCFLRLSGQFYRVDLVPLPYRSCSGELIYSRSLIHQLLPPQGAYEARILFSDGSADCVARIDEEFLSLSLLSPGSASGWEEKLEKGSLHIDSLFLEKRK